MVKRYKGAKGTGCKAPHQRFKVKDILKNELAVYNTLGR
jgi:hypothetical protein